MLLAAALLGPLAVACSTVRQWTYIADLPGPGVALLELSRSGDAVSGRLVESVWSVPQGTVVTVEVAASGQATGEPTSDQVGDAVSMQLIGDSRVGTSATGSYVNGSTLTVVITGSDLPLGRLTFTPSTQAEFESRRHEIVAGQSS